MDILIELTYAALVFAAFRIFKIPANKWTVTTAVVGGVFVVGGIFLSMAYYHPFTKEARIYFQTTPIMPQVRGKVIKMHAQSNTPLKAGDKLFTIDPTPYQAKVDELKSRLVLAERRLAESEKLAKHSAGSMYDVEKYRREVGSIKAQLDKANFDLQSTVVRAPTDGWVTQVRLRPGMMAVPLPLRPVMTFIHSEEPLLVAGFKQNPLQNIKVGATAEVIFPALPGRVFRGKVTTVLNAMAEGQLQPSGNLITVGEDIPASRVPVFIDITDDMSAYNLPLGSSANVAVYSHTLESLSIVRQVLLRMLSWENIVCFEML
ncbi:MAG: HlyD family secretion protein [Deltaproteobacteria bacterium]|nr:HlyD family secretion protein [Deltaproteobacteria bacterium]